MAGVKAGVLEVAYEEAGAVEGTPVVLLHGFPYDVHAFDEVTPILVSRGCRVIVPYLRGYGPTRFLSASTPRSGQQAALGHDLLALLDALSIPAAVLAGYDWGGRAACVVAALWPERARGLAQNRRALCKLLWRLWSPSWRFDDAAYERTAVSFDNPDFVDVVIHSYRHRFRLAEGDPALEEAERRLATRPKIVVPTVVLHGHDNGVSPAMSSEGHAGSFTGRYERRVIPHVGHNIPQEAPREFATAVLSLV